MQQGGQLRTPGGRGQEGLDGQDHVPGHGDCRRGCLHHRDYLRRPCGSVLLQNQGEQF